MGGAITDVVEPSRESMEGIRAGGVPRVDVEATVQSAAAAINFPGFLPRYPDIIEQMITELAARSPR